MSLEGSSNQTVYIQNLPEKVKREELTRRLYHLFSTCGSILDVRIHRANKFRGQAWITFSDVGGAIRAVKEMNNRIFYKKPLRVFFSNNKADIVSKADGTYKPKEAKKNEESTMVDSTNKRKREEDTDAQAYKEAKAADNGVLPSNLLLITNLPPNITEIMVKKFFEHSAGFLAVTLPQPSNGTAKVQFDTIENATECMGLLDGFKIANDIALKLQYAK